MPTAPSSVKTTAPDHVNLPPPPLPANHQSVAQLSASFLSGLSNVGSTMDPPTILANPSLSAQAKGYLIHQTPSSAPQPSQHPNMALPHAPPQYLSAFRPRGVPGPTSKIVAACPSPDGLARDGTQGGKTWLVLSCAKGGALAVGVTSVREGEIESEPVSQPVLPRDHPLA
jgi:hypothetical protein